MEKYIFILKVFSFKNQFRIEFLSLLDTGGKKKNGKTFAYLSKYITINEVKDYYILQSFCFLFRRGAKADREKALEVVLKVYHYED